MCAICTRNFTQNLLDTIIRKAKTMEFSKLYRIMEATGGTVAPASPVSGNVATPSAGIAKPGSDESLNPHSFDKEEVRKALLNIERINKDNRGMYTPLFTHLKKNPEAMQLFGELINTLASAITSVGGRMAKPLNM